MVGFSFCVRYGESDVGYVYMVEQVRRGVEAGRWRVNVKA